MSLTATLDERWPATRAAKPVHRPVLKCGNILPEQLSRRVRRPCDRSDSPRSTTWLATMPEDYQKTHNPISHWDDAEQQAIPWQYSGDATFNQMGIQQQQYS